MSTPYPRPKVQYTYFDACCVHVGTTLLLIYCRVYDLELRLKTPEKFLHPNYEELTWYAAQGLLQKLEGGPLAYVLKLL